MTLEEFAGRLEFMYQPEHYCACAQRIMSKIIKDAKECIGKEIGEPVKSGTIRETNPKMVVCGCNSAIPLREFIETDAGKLWMEEEAKKPRFGL